MQNLKLTVLILAIIFTSACKNSTGDFMTSNGYKYIIHKKGSGPAVKINDVLFYTLTIKADSMLLVEEIDPENLRTTKIESNWKDIKQDQHFYEVLAKSNVGDNVTIVVPADSIPKGNPQLEGKKNINYTIEIMDIMDSVRFAKFVEDKKKKAEEMRLISQARIPEVDKTINSALKSYKDKSLKTETTASGLKYFIHEKGNGKVAKAGEVVKVDYYGILTDGTKFDNSFERGQPYPVNVGTGSVIPGWDEALMLLPKGTKATIFVPSNLGYGDRASGPIPANSELVFYIEIK